MTNDRRLALGELALCMSESVDLDEDDRAIVRGLYKTARDAATGDDLFRELVDAIGRITVYGDYASDFAHLVGDAYWPDDM